MHPPQPGKAGSSFLCIVIEQGHLSGNLGEFLCRQTHFDACAPLSSFMALTSLFDPSEPAGILAVAETSRCARAHRKNRMTEELTFSEYGVRLREFIASHSTERGLQSAATHDLPEHLGILRASADGTLRRTEVRAPERQFNELALALFQLQFAYNPAYRRICEHRGVTPGSVSVWNDIPPVPTTAFKELELTSLAPDERTTVFHSSGTTEQRPSRHFHNAESLAIYEGSVLPWFQHHMLADHDDLVEEQLLGPLDKLPFLILTPPAEQAPHSSLVHMFETVRREFGARDSLFAGTVDATGAWALDVERLLFGIRKSMCANRPVALFGTAFNFVHLLDHFAANNIRYRVARGSRVLETGGYKGRSRVVPKSELHALIAKHLGIPETHIVTEYGMSELSSQAYDRVVGEVQGPRSKVQSQDVASHQSAILRFPPWARAQIISPETGREVPDGETGLIRVFDLANVRSVMAIQTEDLAVRRGDGFELIGRAAKAEPRGCSLMSLNAEAQRR